MRAIRGEWSGDDRRMRGESQARPKLDRKNAWRRTRMLRGVATREVCRPETEVSFSAQAATTEELKVKGKSLTQLHMLSFLVIRSSTGLFAKAD